MITHYAQQNIVVLTILAFISINLSSNASQEASGTREYDNIDEITVNDSLGEIYVNTHSDGTDKVYVIQEVINPGDSAVAITNQDENGHLIINVAYPTNRSASHNVVRNVRG